MKISEQLLEILKNEQYSFDLTFMKSKIGSLKMYDLFQNFPRVLIHLEGKTTLFIDNIEKVMIKPEVVIIGQGFINHWTSTTNSRVIEVIFSVDELVIEYSHQGKTQSEFLPYSSNKMYENIKNINMSLILEEYKSLNREYKLPQVLYYLSICHKYLKGSGSQKIKKTFSRKRFKFRDIQTYIHQNMDRNLTRVDIVERFRINITTLSKLFQFWERTSFKQYVIDMKLTEARNYLLQNDISIVDLSRKYGFNSPDHFIYTFKKNFYYSPLKLKNLLAKPNSLAQLRDLYKLNGFEFVKEEHNQVFTYTEGPPQLCYIINATGDKVNLYWLNEVGQKVKLDEMFPHKRLRCNAFEGYCFVLEGSKQKRKVFKVPKYKSQIIFY